jgi:two-component system response regulator FixJ
MPAVNEPQDCALAGLPLPVIYIVDDDDMFRQSLDFLLTTVGYTVDARMDGRMLIEKLPTLAPGCIIIDLRMPQIDGFDVLKALRTRAPDFPVIIVTGHGDATSALQAQRQGASDFFEKPVPVDRLLQSIATALAKIPHREAA